MNFILQDGIRTYSDIANFFAAYGWGCKVCGKLAAGFWWQCSGDTYCGNCKDMMDSELKGLVWHEYIKTDAPGKHFTRDEQSQGFEYAVWQRQEFERIYG